MNRFNILIVPFGIFVLVMMNLIFIKYNRDFNEEFQERRLAIATNYAVDAAVDELVLYSEDLGMDYADYEKLAVGPDIALETFCRVFCMNYGMSLTEENYSLVKANYLKAFLVAAYDGYYIAEPTVINTSGAVDMVFSMKHPYLYQSANGLYALNLGLTDAKLYSGSSVAKVDSPITAIEQRQIINQNISDALMSTVYRQKQGSVFSTIYVPSAMTNIVTTNPVDKVTVFAYVSDVDFTYGDALETFGIGGARVTHAQYVGCYNKDGLPTYAFVEDIDRSTTNVIAMYESPELAARAGYYFDMTTLSD